MTIDEEIQKASVIMSIYRMAPDDQIKVARILLDAGVERCLQEQDKLSQRKNEMITKAQRGFPN